MTGPSRGSGRRAWNRRWPVGPQSSHYLSVIIPVYNEADRIADSLEQVDAYLSTQGFRSEIVVVDDGSADATTEVVRRAAARHTGIRLVCLEHQGKGWAVKHGMLAATGEYRLLCDADLSVPIEQVERLLPPRARGVNIAIGSREACGARRHGEPTRRHLMGRLFNALVRCVLFSGVKDSQCGFKCFQGDHATKLFGLQTIRGFAFDVEVIHLARQRNLRIAEIAVDWHYRDSSKVRLLRDSVAMTLDLLRIRWRHRRRYRVERSDG